jgi:hypothetical protein
LPKLDGTHLPQRLAQRLADLKSQKEVAARDIRALLSKEQVAEMDAAWKQQQTLRKQKRARNKQEERQLGWKSKRDIHIDAYEKAVTAANKGVLQEFERLQTEAAKRQMRIYMNTIKAQLAAGKEMRIAKNAANNNLTRAGLRRLDGQMVYHTSRRDKEIWELERQILEKLRSEITADELEQLELKEEHEKSQRDNWKKRAR